MLTGLDIASTDDGHLFDRKAERKVETRNIGGWSGYIQKYQRTGPVDQREHAIFHLSIGSRKIIRWRPIPPWPIPARLYLLSPPSSG